MSPSIQDASTKTKPNHNKNKKKTTPTRHKKKSQHGRWSADQFMDNWRMHEEIPQGSVWQCKTKAKHQTKKFHTTICEPGSNKCTMRKPRLPPARSPRSQSTAAQTLCSQIHRYDPKASRCCLVASDKKTLKGETWWGRS